MPVHFCSSDSLTRPHYIHHFVRSIKSKWWSFVQEYYVSLRAQCNGCTKVLSSCPRHPYTVFFILLPPCVGFHSHPQSSSSWPFQRCCIFRVTDTHVGPYIGSMNTVHIKSTGLGVTVTAKKIGLGGGVLVLSDYEPRDVTFHQWKNRDKCQHSGKKTLHHTDSHMSALRCAYELRGGVD